MCPKLSWVVYQSPDDYPGKFVARPFNGTQKIDVVLLADTHAELIKQLPGELIPYNRHPTDPPSLQQIWLNGEHLCHQPI